METLPLEWVRAARFCELTGESIDTLYDRINDGVWAAGRHYKRIGKRTLWINLLAFNSWINSQPHVESVPFPKASKSARANAATACA